MLSNHLNNRKKFRISTKKYPKGRYYFHNLYFPLAPNENSIGFQWRLKYDMFIPGAPSEEECNKFGYSHEMPFETINLIINFAYSQYNSFVSYYNTKIRVGSLVLHILSA